MVGIKFRLLILVLGPFYEYKLLNRSAYGCGYAKWNAREVIIKPTAVNSG